MSRAQQRRVVFFDLDGTLHQQDMFGTFLRFLLWHHPLNLLLVVPALLTAGGPCATSSGVGFHYSGPKRALAYESAALDNYVWT